MYFKYKIDFTSKHALKMMSDEKVSRPTGAPIKDIKDEVLEKMKQSLPTGVGNAIIKELTSLLGDKNSAQEIFEKALWENITAIKLYNELHELHTKGEKPAAPEPDEGVKSPPQGQAGCKSYSDAVKTLALVAKLDSEGWTLEGGSPGQVGKVVGMSHKVMQKTKPKP